MTQNGNLNSHDKRQPPLPPPQKKAFQLVFILQIFIISKSSIYFLSHLPTRCNTETAGLCHFVNHYDMIHQELRAPGRSELLCLRGSVLCVQVRYGVLSWFSGLDVLRLMKCRMLKDSDNDNYTRHQT